MAAGSNRDFTSIHHNCEYARSTVAGGMYANTPFLLGMWERTVCDWIGPAGTITAARGIRMRSFDSVGDTTTVSGTVISVDHRHDEVVLRLRSENSSGITVGPGTVTVTLPRSTGG